MKIYLATSGEYSDYQVLHAFTRREDAEAYELGDDVLGLDLHDGPIETRPWHSLQWDPRIPDRPRSAIAGENPFIYRDRRDFDGRPERAEHQWLGNGDLVVQGWDKNRVLKVYSEQRAQHIARRDAGTEAP